MPRARGARVLGAALAAYGLGGVVLLAGAALAIGPTLDTISTLGRSSTEVRATLAATRDAFDGFGSSLTEGRQSAERAAASARSSADAARQLSGAMSINLFGAQPLLPIATGFARQSADLATLATELDELGTSLGSNGDDLRDLQNQIAELELRTSELADSPLVASAGRAGPLAYALLAWLALQAIAALCAGVVLWRTASV